MESKANKCLKYIYNKGYRVSFCGRFIFTGKRYILSDHKTNKGYYAINVRLNEYCSRVLWHRLQALQKFGDKIFEPGILVRHLDGNQLNNSWANIGIGNNSDNMLDKDKSIRDRDAINASRVKQNSIRTLEERYEIYNKLQVGIPYSKISLEHNITKSTLSYMKNNSLEYTEYIKTKRNLKSL